MRWFLMALALFQLPAQVQAPLAGSYTVAGTNEDGSEYAGTATVTEHDGLVDAKMYDQAGDLGSIALCLREGAVVSCIFQTRDLVVGVASYRIEGDKWIGRWYVPGSMAILKEVLTRVDPRLHGAETGPKFVL